MQKSLAERLARAERVANAPATFYVRRPIHVIERVDGRPQVVEKLEFLDVLIDRRTGKRSVLQRLKCPAKIARWHERAHAPNTKLLDCPVTCTRAQLPLILDDRSK